MWAGIVLRISQEPNNRLPAPSYAERFLKKKRIVETDNWDDLSSHEHAHAFTVAHSINAGILDDTLGLLIKAKETGMPYKEFAKQYAEKMQAKGWYGKGTKQRSKRYQQWRTKVIYETNMRTAAAAGAWRQQVRVADTRPNLVYKSRLYGGNRRASHTMMHNVSYPVGHDFWQEHYPPNGWGCQCYVVSMTDTEIQEKRIRQGDGVAARALANTTPKEWKQNVGREAMAPRFGDMNYIRQYPAVMQNIVKAYADDMRDAALTGTEFAAVAEQLAGYKDAKVVPDVPVVVGAMNDEVWDAVQKVAPAIDVKLHGSTRDVIHAMRSGKAHRVPTEKLADVWDTMSNPDVVYLHKGATAFTKEVGTDQFVKVVFGNKRNTILRLRTFGIFDKEDIGKNMKEGKLLYKRSNQ